MDVLVYTRDNARLGVDHTVVMFVYRAYTLKCVPLACESKASFIPICVMWSRGRGGQYIYAPIKDARNGPGNELSTFSYIFTQPLRMPVPDSHERRVWCTRRQQCTYIATYSRIFLLASFEIPTQYVCVCHDFIPECAHI